MRDDWGITTIGKVCQVIAGQSPKGRYYNSDGNGLPFYQGKKEFGDKFLGPPLKWTTQITREAIDGDILMSVRAPVGPINFTNKTICIGRGLAAIRSGRNIDRDFLFYLLLCKQDEIKGTEGAVYPSINKTQIENILIPLPPLSEQKRIVAILDSAFAAIDSAVVNSEKNLANAREVFESYINQRILDVATRSTTQTLNCLADLIVDCEHKTAPTQEYGLPSIRTPNIGKGHLILNDVNRVSEETYRAWTRRAEPRPGDLILAREAPAGNVGVIPNGERVCLGQRTVLLRPIADVDSQFLAFLLLHPLIQARLLSSSAGATVEHVNMKDIRALALSELPPLRVQQNIVDDLLAVQGFGKQLASFYTRKLALLAELRQSILQQAFRGELTGDGQGAECTLSEVGG